MSLPSIDVDYLVDFLTRLLNTPSPTGYAARAVALTEQALAQFSDLKLKRNRKGALLAEWPGAESGTPRALTAHADTLGAMVKDIKSNGRLKLTPIGGYAWNTIEGEGVTIFPSTGGDPLRGTVLLSMASSHV